MGYDCTLHVIDPDAIREDVDGWIANLCEQPRELCNAPVDIGDLWASAAYADGRAAVASAGFLALTYSAAFLPCHGERNVALSLLADFPEALRGDPASLFPALLGKRPMLRDEFFSGFSGNYDVGVFVAPRDVAQAAAWLEAHPAEHTTGLLTLLRLAAANGLAYWESSDLPVRGPGFTAGLENVLPDAAWRYTPSPRRALFRALGGSDVGERFRAAVTLADQQDVRAFVVLRRTLVNGDDASACEAARVLVRNRDRDALPVLEETEASNDPEGPCASMTEMYEWAAAELRNVLDDGERQADASRLMRLLENENESVWRRAIKGLVQLGPAALNPLVLNLTDWEEDDPDLEETTPDEAVLRTRCLEVLAQTRPPEALRPIANCLHDSAWEVRVAAAYALRYFSAAAAPDLVRVLRDPVEAVRLQAVLALTQLHVTDAIADLEATRGGPDLIRTIESCVASLRAYER